MGSIVFIEGKKAFTTTLEIAKGVGNEHRSVKKLIDDNSNTDTLSTLPVSKALTAGRPVEYYTLDEQQATFLMTLMSNSPRVKEFKEKLVKEFFRQRDIISRLIAQQKDPDWQNVRGTGKQVYFQKTDVIKEFVDYATAQGSKSAKMYYMNLAKMENKTLFFFEQTQKRENMREIMTIKQLMQVATADDVIEKALKEGMERQLPYKECYVLAKERVVAFAEIIGRSPILSLES